MENTRNTTETEQEILSYLNDLRSSGATNMFGAGPYIEAEFPELNKRECRAALMLWMTNFNEEGNYKTVKL